jgi:hypothetical protein
MVFLQAIRKLHEMGIPFEVMIIGDGPMRHAMYNLPRAINCVRWFASLGGSVKRRCPWLTAVPIVWLPLQ